MRLILLLTLAAAFRAEAADLVVVSWNLHDFPSGRYNLRASAEIEATHLREGARALAALRPDIVLLQEIRDAEACSNLCAALNLPDFRVASCSRYTDEAGIPLFQQDAVLSRLRCLSNTWGRWHTVGLCDPPRGYAEATLAAADYTVRVFSVHLKSNLTQGNAVRETQLNILKRELAMEQLLGLLDETPAVIVGGDLNTDEADLKFASEKTIPRLRDAGFRSCFGETDATPVTRRGSAIYRDATFDYLWLRGQGATWNGSSTHASPLSDHHAVRAVLRVPGNPAP